jgi:ABC-2 type transport system permease protein
MIQGQLESAYKDKPNPVWNEGEGQGGDRTGRTLKMSPETARLVVIGSSSFTNDMVLGLSRQVSGDRYTNNLQFVENLVDWAVADVDLLSIRSRGTFARTLVPMEAAERAIFEYGNYGLVVLALGVIIAVTAGRRRRLQPMPLDPAPGKKPRAPAPTIGGTTEVRS